MMTAETFSITQTTKGKLARLPFKRMKEAVLGASYDLSVAIVGDQRMRNANNLYRGIDAVTDILSFSLTSRSGEILIHLKSAAKKARAQAIDEKQYLGFLFIHGLLHLKGHLHGSIMEREEKKWCRTLGIIFPF